MKRYNPVLLTTLSLIAYVGLLSVHLKNGTLTHAYLPQTLGWFGLAFVTYLIMIWQVESKGGISWRYLWGGAVLFRLLLLFTTPTLSSDIYRYLWDGYVANNGISPYAFPIDSPQLDWLEAPIRAQANHTWMASPYLPAAQWLFGTVTWLSPLSPLSMQVAMVLIDLLNGLLIATLLTLAKLPRYRVLIYLWNPLVIVEIVQGAHLDGWMSFLTLLAVWLAIGQSAEVGRRAIFHLASDWLSPILLALATLTKIIPALLIAILFWRWRWRPLALYLVTVSAFLLAAGTRAGWGLLGPLDGHGLFAALRIYGDRWNFNSGLFHWVEVGLTNDALFGLALTDANQWAKRVVGICLLAILLFVWLSARQHAQPRQLLRLMAIPLMAYVLLTTTFHPWYLLLPMAFLPFLTPAPVGAELAEASGQWLLVVPWLYLSGALFLSYLTYLDPLDLREYAWIRQVEWLPTIGLLATGGVWFVGNGRKISAT